jgi:hypothetical protein
MTLDYCGAAPASLHCSGLDKHVEELEMTNPLDSLWGTVIVGLVLTVILYFAIRTMTGG